jgi:neutral trehalase
MIELGGMIGEDVQEFKEWNELSISAMNRKLWNEKTAMYDAYDLINNEPLLMEASSGLMPLFAGVPDAARAGKVVERLQSAAFSGTPQQPYYLCPSFTPLSDKFDRQKYWRGPVWINMNWMLFHGLNHYGYHELAEKVKADSLELLSHYGFYEYFDPIRGIVHEQHQGYGSRQFSWSAALCLDWVS